MADKSFKVNETIEVVYQAGGAGSGVAVTMDVYDEAGVLDAAQSGAMVEIGTTGRYRKSFTPDAEGLWHVQVSDANGGNAVKSYSVGTTNVSEIGATVTSINAKVDNIQTAIAGLGSPPMIA